MADFAARQPNCPPPTPTSTPSTGFLEHLSAAYKQIALGQTALTTHPRLIHSRVGQLFAALTTFPASAAATATPHTTPSRKSQLSSSSTSTCYLWYGLCTASTTVSRYLRWLIRHHQV